MAQFTSSPGVTLNEIDLTFLTGQPVQAGAAIIGPTVKGPVEVPTLVTSYTDFTNKFGETLVSSSGVYSYFTSVAAQNYFKYGGNSLLVTRVVSGSYTSATSSLIETGSGGPTTGLSPFEFETLSKGVIMNNNGSEGTNNVISTGTDDNLRWEITNSNSGSGTFNVLIRRGNDASNKKIILESFNNVNLDPNSPRYIARVMGDYDTSYDSTNNQIAISGSYPNVSRYVRIKSVNYATPNYFDGNGTAKDQYTGSIPINQSGSFSGAAGDIKGGAKFNQDITANNTQGLEGANYDNMISLLSNTDQFQFNVLFAPGLTNDLHTTQISNIITNTISRGDNLFVMDLGSFGSSVAGVIAEAQTHDTSYAASYFPWVRVIEPITKRHMWVPPSTVIPGVYAYNDKVKAPWFAPAGINRGGLNTVIAAEYRLSQGQKDTLYEANVNPLATLPREGVVVFGQKTLQKEASALDRINVRRLLIEMKGYIRQIADTIVFEQNTIATRNSFVSRVTPYLEGIQQKQGLYAFKVVMDETNNGPDVIDRNQLIGQIYIQPTRTAEFVSLDFILLPTGAEFPA